MKVLVIDDTSSSRLLISKILKSIIKEVEVTLCAYGEEAVDLLINEEENYDFIILDLGLPDISGFQLLEILETLEDSSKVITISDESSQTLLAKSLERGALAYITKPLFKDQLMSAIELIKQQTESLEPVKPSNLVLIVDDIKTNRVINKAFIKSAGYESIEAENGIEAVEIARNHDLACILMDIRMPIMDGIEATRIIRQTNTTLPIIAVTAESNESIFNDCHNVGMNAILHKPINKHQLLSIMSEHLAVTSKSFSLKDDFN